MEIDPDLVIPDPRMTIGGGCVKPMQTAAYLECQDDLVRFFRRRKLPLDVPWAELPEETRRLVWEGEPGGREQWRTKWYGLRGFFAWLEGRSYRMHVRVLLSRYRRYSPCPTCSGARLRPDALLFRLGGHTLPALEAMPLAELAAWFGRWAPGASDAATDLL